MSSTVSTNWTSLCDAFNAKHDMPYSKVIHCRSVPDGCREGDLIQAVRMFGNVEALRLIPKKNQALIEFEAVESAIACVTYSNLQPIFVGGSQMFVNYSKSSEITRQFNDCSIDQQPTQILLMTIINVIHPVDVEIIRKICEKESVDVQRIVFFHKNGLQALAEFKNIDDASHIQQTLNGCDIYPGCCTLKIEYSTAAKLNVRSNTSELYNVDIIDKGYKQFDYSNSSEIPDSLNNNKLMTKLSSLLENQENQTAVQNIVLKVLAGGSLNGTQASAPPGVKGLLPSSPLPSSPATLLDTSQEHYYQLPKYLNQINLSGAIGIGGVGGVGCVAMVYGINNDVVNCNHLFNLFCLYGNVVRIKILVNKPGSGMVQYANKMSTQYAINHLSNVTLFGQEFQVAISKHPYIAESSQSPTSTLFDGTPSCVNFHESLNNRFKSVQGELSNHHSMIHPPSKVLHYFNAPPDYSEEQLKELFESCKAEIPLKHVQIPKVNTKSSLGLLEFSSVAKAVEAIMKVSHVTVRVHSEGNMDSALSAEKSGAPFTLKLAFSSSESING